MDYDKCPELYRKNVTGGRRRLVTVNEVAGEAGHRIAGGDSTESARQFIERTLHEAAPAVRDAVMERAVEFSQSAGELDDTDVSSDDKEVQLVWEVFGWKIFAKPDQLFFADRCGRKLDPEQLIAQSVNGREFLMPDPTRPGHGNERPVLVIKDIKSGTRVTARHKRQLFWFGLVAAQSLNWTGWIDLVVSLPDAGKEVTLRYSRREEPRKMSDLRFLLSSIEQSWQKQDFEARARISCTRCKFFSECPLAQAFIAAQEGEIEPEALTFVPLKVVARHSGTPAILPAQVPA